MSDWIGEAASQALRLGQGVLRAEFSPVGKVSWSTRPLPLPAEPLRVGVARGRVENDALVPHKTTRRAVYERCAAEAQARRLDAIVLRNPQDRLTETAVHSLLFRLNGRWWTPPLADGLVAGVARAALLRRGAVGERPLALAEVRSGAPTIAVCNAVVGVVRAVWAD
jgi:para-aminobenzoate synthetase/4-amino-4-deoxychorismate lyase